MSRQRSTDREPLARDLRAIEREWPVIAAELAVVDAEIAAARAGDTSSELGRRRLRRAHAHLTRVVTSEIRRGGDLGGAA
jgi:hypothetical protein